MERKDIEAKVNSVFKENSLTYDFYVSNDRVEVTIIWGDWKHDHRRLELIMEQAGFTPDGYRVTESDGSDCYSAVRFYKI